MGAAAEKHEPEAFPLTKQWFDTREAAIYMGGRATAESVRKLIQRGKLRPDAPAGTRGISGHRLHRSTLDAYLGKTG